MDFRQISYFVALYEEGSVTRAANRLNVVQPAVSMQIAKLEGDLGQKLFERRSKAMVPTAAGRTLHRLVVPVLRNLTLAREHMAKLSGVISGRITIGMLASLAASLVPDMLTAFARDFPEVEVVVVDGYSSTFIDLVNQDAVDFAVINKPPRRLGAILEPLVEEQMVYVTAAAPGSGGGPIGFKELQQAKLILPSRRHGLRAELDRHFEARDVALDLQLEMDSIQGICEVVARSEWATILPSLAVYKGLAAGELAARAISPRMTRQLAIIHHPRHPLTPAADAFIKRLREHVEIAVGSGITPGDPGDKPTLFDATPTTR
ncbi:MAG: LysR family transcriptional regulator [Pararhizobium sp.]